MKTITLKCSLNKEKTIKLRQSEPNKELVIEVNGEWGLQSISSLDKENMTKLRDIINTLLISS